MNALYRRAKIRVLVVDDSAVVRDLISHVLTSDPQIEVVGSAADGVEAMEAVRLTSPDLVTMDVDMPHLTGLEATRQIMETRPVPILIVTGCSKNMETAAAFRLLEAGALAILAKPPGPGDPRYEAAARELVQAVKTMSEVKVIRRWPRRADASPSPGAASVRATDAQRIADDMKAIAIGASTGGPVALKTILCGLPRDYPVPILVVQHIADGFTIGLADWLRQACAFDVRLASHGQRISARTAYVAPDGKQMSLADEDHIAITDGARENGHRPSVSHLFRSVADTLGQRAVGVLLTGMGKDGADELGRMRSRGALTIAQDERSSVVHGMPGEAIARQAAVHVLAPPDIAALLTTLANHRKRSH